MCVVVRSYGMVDSCDGIICIAQQDLDVVDSVFTWEEVLCSE